MKSILLSFSVLLFLGCQHQAAQIENVEKQSRSSPADIEKDLVRNSPNDPDPQWRALLFENEQELENIPQISVRSIVGNVATVLVTNAGKTTLEYYSAGPSHIQCFQETFGDERWTMQNWDWCGTGKESFEIPPGKSVELTVSIWDDDNRTRMLACFSEKNSTRASLVVLATEP